MIDTQVVAAVSSHYLNAPTIWLRFHVSASCFLNQEVLVCTGKWMQFPRDAGKPSEKKKGEEEKEKEELRRPCWAHVWLESRHSGAGAHTLKNCCNSHSHTPTPPYGDAIKKRHYLRIFTHFWQARRRARQRAGGSGGGGAQTKATFTSSAPEWCLNSGGICRGRPWGEKRHTQGTTTTKQKPEHTTPPAESTADYYITHNNFCLVCFSIF